MFLPSSFNKILLNENQKKKKNYFLSSKKNYKTKILESQNNTVEIPLFRTEEGRYLATSKFINNLNIH